MHCTNSPKSDATPYPKQQQPHHDCRSRCCCIWSSLINRELSKLCQRYKKSVTKRKKIHELARPKYRRPKNCEKENHFGEIFQKNIKFTSIQDRRVETRTEQLAYPQVSQITKLKRHPSYHNFTEIRKSCVNRLFRKSLLSLYSHLSNIPAPTKPSKRLKWNEDLKKLKFMATPKKYASPNDTKKQSEDAAGNEFNPKRLKKLCKPRQYKKEEPFYWSLKPSVKNYKPTERILKMSKPKQYETFDIEELFKIKQTALEYRATKRIKDLAMASDRLTYKKVEGLINPFAVSPNAMKAKASERIQQLAAPNEYSDMHNRAEPFKIPPSALTYKATPRVLKLAEPKKSSV